MSEVKVGGEPWFIDILILIYFYGCIYAHARTHNDTHARSSHTHSRQEFHARAPMTRAHTYICTHACAHTHSSHMRTQAREHTHTLGPTYYVQITDEQ